MSNIFLSIAVIYGMVDCIWITCCLTLGQTNNYHWRISMEVKREVVFKETLLSNLLVLWLNLEYCSGMGIFTLKSAEISPTLFIYIVHSLDKILLTKFFFKDGNT